jgi:cation diffusion facilitator CzcD-associated flavoprotein CzcO
MQPETLDVLIVGAGVSGIGMACRLVAECPGKTFAIVERRARLGGTWDLFRYPGIRSDSDMLTYGYESRPWQDPRVLGDGATIRRYLADTARACSIDTRIRYGRSVTQARWSSAQQRWTVDVVDDGGAAHTVVVRQLVMGTGYFRYDAGHTPALPGLERFGGTVVHPQHWPESLDCRGKRVVVLGSGATAVTLVPALAAQGARVTMLQRSPGFFFAVPAIDKPVALLARVLPARLVYGYARRRNTAVSRWLYIACRRWPQRMRRLLMGLVRRQLRGTSVDMRHFTPAYQPWEERLCIVPDNDLFAAIRSGSVDVVTDHVAGFEPGGASPGHAAGRVLLRSGAALDADVLVTATGLEIQAFGGATVHVDGREVQPHEHMFYRGVMLDSVPNFAWIVGYINHAWTLKVDLATRWLCRLYRHMDERGHAVAVAHDAHGCRTDASILDGLRAGYVARARDRLPRQGSRAPWISTHDVAADRRLLLDEPIDDGVLAFEPARPGASTPAGPANAAALHAA